MATTAATAAAETTRDRKAKLIGSERTRTAPLRHSSGGWLCTRLDRLADRAPVEIAADHDLGPDLGPAEPARQPGAPVEIPGVLHSDGAAAPRAVVGAG